MLDRITADGICRRVTDIRPEALSGRGIRLVLLDLDNTLAPYGEGSPGQDVVAWCRRLAAAGIEPFLLTNSRDRERTEAFGTALGARWICRAGKPRRAGYLAAIGSCGAKPWETAMVGDQVFTDVAGAKAAGVRAILAEPMDLSYRFLHRVRYLLEAPFRARARLRQFP